MQTDRWYVINLFTTKDRKWRRVNEINENCGSRTQISRRFKRTEAWTSFCYGFNDCQIYKSVHIKYIVSRISFNLFYRSRRPLG